MSKPDLSIHDVTRALRFWLVCEGTTFEWRRKISVF